jgi:hypothetical protein
MCSFTIGRFGSHQAEPLWPLAYAGHHPDNPSPNDESL